MSAYVRSLGPSLGLVKRGFLQSTRGHAEPIKSRPMIRKNRTTGVAQEILNENVRIRMRLRYSDQPNTTQRIRALARESGVGKSTIQRLVDPRTYGEHRTSLPVIEALAKALRCETFELLVPYQDEQG